MRKKLYIVLYKILVDIERMFSLKEGVLGHLVAVITIIIWGATYVSTKFLLVYLSPIEILCYRFLLAYLVLLLIYPKFKTLTNIREEFLFLGAGFTGGMLFFLIENIALKYTTAANVGLLVSISPILTALMAYYFIGVEKLSKKFLLGSILAIVGVFLVIFNGEFNLQLNIVGDVLALLAAIVWACYSIILRKIGKTHNYLYVTRKTFFYGLVTLLPILYIYGIEFKIEKLLSYSVLPNILYLSLGASLLGFIMWNIAINRLGVVKASTYIYLVPFITIVIARIILNEKLSHFSLLGGVLILMGLYITEYGFNKIRIPNSLKNKAFREKL